MERAHAVGASGNTISKLDQTLRNTNTTEKRQCHSTEFPNAYRVPGGRLLAGEYPGDTDERKTRAKVRALLEAGVRVFIDLTEAGELVPYEAVLREEAYRLDLSVAYFRRPIGDVDVPVPARMARILGTITAALALGHTVYVHCWGGVGRTGTVVGCRLVEQGMSGDEALDTVQRLFAEMSASKRRRHPGGSTETAAQLEFVRRWSGAGRQQTARVRPKVFEQDRLPFIRGCLLGGAVGDALGAPVEFLSAAQIRTAYGPAGITEFDTAYGFVGAITDDTQMTLFTAEGLLRAVARNQDRGICHAPSSVYRAYLRWLTTQGEPVPDVGNLADFVEGQPGWLVKLPALQYRRAPGTTCLSALRSGEMGTREVPLNDRKGCGGVMRAAPAGLFPDCGDPFQLGCDIAAITHGHPSGYLTAGVLSGMISILVDGASVEEAVTSMLTRVRTEPGHEETSAALEMALTLARSGPPTVQRVEQLGEGWVAEEALAIAVYCALVAGEDFEAGVRLAVNHSGDSDSTGAITGNILGTMLGLDAIPARWLAKLELRTEITALADDVFELYEEGAEWASRYPPN